MTPQFEVLTTGLWVNSASPELACSPDGLVKDLRQEVMEQYWRVEIKCPSTLKEFNVNDFDQKLTEKQKEDF